MSVSWAGKDVPMLKDYKGWSVFVRWCSKGVDRKIVFKAKFQDEIVLDGYSVNLSAGQLMRRVNSMIKEQEDGMLRIKEI